MRSAYGHIQNVGRGKWRAWWYEGEKKCSKRCQSYKEASEHLARMQLISGKINFNATYNDYYKSAIIPSYKHLAKRSVHELKLAWKELQPRIGKKKISDTNWHLVQDVIDQYDSPARQRKILAFWKRMLNFAIKDKIIRTNPCCEGIKLKRLNKREKVLYTKEELVDVLHQVKDTEFAIPILLECCCGLRHEEYCGLDRRDFDFEDEGWCYISINKAVTNVGGSKVLTNTKTTNSTRIVCLHGSFKPYYLRHNNFMKNKYTIKEYRDPCCLTRRWKNYCERMNIKYVPFGNMRSIYATLCAEAGCLDSIVSKAMGHSGGTVKERNYQTATMKALKINAETLSEYINFS